MTQNKISAYLVVYNEEKHIAACLKSLRLYVDEVIVLHDGPCDDDTINICRAYNCEVYQVEHVGEAEPHRPLAITKCRYDWVLQIDADERLSPALAESLPGLVSENQIDAYRFNWIAEINGKESNFLTKQILFRKSKMYFIGLPHRQCETRGIIKYVNLDLLHDTSEYDTPWQLLKKYLIKNKNWGRIGAKMLAGSVNNIPAYNCDITDNNLEQMKKIRLIKKYPLIAIFTLPFYSLYYRFFIYKGYKQGWLGFVLSCHIPIYIFFISYYLIKMRIFNIITKVRFVF